MRNSLITQVLAAFAILLNLGWCKKSDCYYNKWPVYVGDKYQETKTSCLFFDELYWLVIAAGTATDKDSRGYPTTTGFVYALDSKANWVWGNTFYNETDHINTIDKCSLSSDEKSLAVFGELNNSPAIFTIDIETGRIQEHIYINYESRRAKIVLSAIYV